MTKNELIRLITKKVENAKPIAKQVFVNGLKYKTKKELQDILHGVMVSEDGYDITVL